MTMRVCVRATGPQSGRSDFGRPRPLESADDFRFQPDGDDGADRSRLGSDDSRSEVVAVE
jgi:hypothetical protein